jgi:hypothetical protein
MGEIRGGCRLRSNAGLSEKLESKDEDKNDAEPEERLEISHYRDSMVGTESWSV